MRDGDAQKFGAIVDQLIGVTCERSLAANSLKFRFNTSDGPRGTHYIWIDPPWEFRHSSEVITASSDYENARFHEWSALFNPLNSTKLEGWKTDEVGLTEFAFSEDYRIVVPHETSPVRDDDWYIHWYASDRTV